MASLLLTFIVLVIFVLVVLGFLALALNRLPTPRRAPAPVIKNAREPEMPDVDESPLLRCLQSVQFWKGIIFLISLAAAYKYIGAPFLSIYKSAVAGREVSFVTVVYSYAWIAYGIMGAFWVANVRLGKFFPVSGTLAGLFGVATVAPFVFPIFYLAPQIVLAVKFVRFHMTTES